MEEAMEMARSNNIEERIAGVERLRQVLDVSRKSLSWSEMSNLVQICLDTMKNNDFRASEGALRALTSAAALSGVNFKPHFIALVPPVVERLGDPNQAVRDAARRLLLALMEKQTKLVLDENQFLENILRTLLQELVASAVKTGEEVMHFGKSIDDHENGQAQIPHLLDIVLYLCEKEHVEAGMIFQLLEDLTEMSTMRNCKDIFGYIESKQDVLGKPELFGRGKLVMLRTCNQLLRRLSKANDVVFCGRILMFLAHFFPLSERSAVNIKGVFNTTNATTYEKIAPEGVSIDFNFYKTFWSLQEYFCNPAAIILTPAKWQKFMSSLLAVLNTFEAQPLNDEEGNIHNLEDEAHNFNIKYLTSSKLMGLELKDPIFRRQILIQCLILFDYLKAPGKPDRDIPSEKMKEEIKSCENHVKKLLEITPPKGKKFLHNVEHILEREKNWVWWKRDGCQPFEKQPQENKTIHEGVRKRKPRWRLGNKELSQLWKWADQNRNALTDAERVRTPSVMEYWKPLAEDMDESAGIDAEYHHKNNKVYCWKGLRFSARQDLEGFSRFSEYGVEGVIPLQLLPPHIRSKYQNKLSDRSKRVKPDGSKRHNAPRIEEKIQDVAPITVMGGEKEEGVRSDVLEPLVVESGNNGSSTHHIVRDDTIITPPQHDMARPSSDAVDIDMVEAGEVEEEEAEVEVELGAIGDGETDPDLDLEAGAE